MAREDSDEVTELRQRLEEVEETLRAIRSGAVDALVVSGSNGEQVYTLQGADRPYRILVEQLEEGAATLNEEGVVLYCNRRFAEMLKTTLDQVIGAPFQSFMESGCQAAAFFTSGAARNQSVKLKAADGNSFPASISVGRLDLDEVNGYVVAVTDLSNWKRMECELFEAQKRESLGRLASGIAHDFNNILGIICGYVYFLENSRGTEEHREGTEGIKSMVERGGRLVRQLLAYARKGRASFKPFDLRATLEELTRMLNQTFPKDIAVSLRLPPGLPPVHGDQNEIYQALLNLAVNARDAMPRGGRLQFETELIDGAELAPRVLDAAERRYVRVSVADTGLGISESMRTMIFEPFFSTKAGEAESGLGLAVVHETVKNHGGFIEVESEEGRGTAFRLYLPVKDDEPVLPGMSPYFQTDKRSFAKAETILFVEDEEAQMAVMKRVLENHGYAVLEARNGDQAVELFRDHKDKVSVVILDLGLPVLSGEETLLKLKKEGSGAKLILTSGYIDPRAQAELLQTTAFDFIQKPYSPMEIVRLVERVLSSGQAAVNQ